MLFTLLLVVYILVAVVLVISILLQSGQGGGLSGAFGGGNQTLFGGRGAATFLTHATTYLGAAFLVLSLLLAVVQTHRSGGTAGSRNIIQETLAPRPGGQTGEASPAPGTETGMPSEEPGGAGGLPEGGSVPAAEPTGGTQGGGTQ
jgi:preprotein translocase subunit SecG